MIVRGANLAVLGMKVNDEVAIMCCGEHAGRCFGHFMICDWEKFGDGASHHLQRRHSSVVQWQL